MKIKALKFTFLFIDSRLKQLDYASHSLVLDSGCSPVIQTLDIRFLQFHLYINNRIQLDVSFDGQRSVYYSNCYWR